MRPSSLLALLLLLLALLFISFTEAGKQHKRKKHHAKKKKKKLGAQNEACSLSHGLSQDECTALASKGCPVTWVGMCTDDSLDGFGGCQVKNNCAHMKCPSTCSNNGNCHWDYTSQTCASGLSGARFCQVTKRDDGDDAFLSPDKTQFFVNNTNAWGAAITCTTSKTVNDWYFRVDYILNPGYILIGITPGPFNLSGNSLWAAWSQNPSTNPEGGFFYEDDGYAFGDLEYEITENERDCGRFGSQVLPGDIIGVHLDRPKRQVWWDVNGANPRFPCQLVMGNVSATLEYYGIVSYFSTSCECSLFPCGDE